MIRRKLTLKRVDPWSVLKFGAVVNIAFLLIALLGFWILWFVIGRLGLVDQFCDSVGSIVLDLQECSLNGGNIFRTLLFLGLLGVVVQTGIFVFAAFLYNLISDLTGGLAFSFLDESAEPAATARKAETTRTVPAAAPSSPRSAGGSDQPQREPRPPPREPERQPERAPEPSSDRPVPSSAPAERPAEPARPLPPESSGSLWGDPTRTTERP